jgi:hypothetical protein
MEIVKPKQDFPNSDSKLLVGASQEPFTWQCKDPQLGQILEVLGMAFGENTSLQEGVSGIYLFDCAFV